ncbi:MAG: 16S rRNA (uracil(1498)-N(3))-methyltransferase [Tissierellia bacterium]|nr:16S rRNA (uracil(1498)-N(3))-methyltransferase [Tissierellia bacterium]
MYRFFGISHENEGLLLSKEDTHHCKSVLRLEEGSLIECVYESKVYQGNLSFIDNRGWVFNLELVEEVSSNLTLYLCQGIPKGQKMEEIIRHGTEAGINVFIPLKLKRCISNISNKEEKKLKRWQSIAESGAKQSKSLEIPMVETPMTLEEALKYLEDTLILVAYEEEKEMILSQVLKEDIPRKVALFIGPEGGFEKEEIQMIKEYGGYATSLGPRILRTETAGVIGSFIIRYEVEMR